MTDDEDASGSSRHRLRKNILIGLFVALYVVVDLIPSPFGGATKFSGFFLILSGFLGGPWAGLLVGAIGDLWTYFIHPKGMYFPGFTLTSALTGFLPVLVAGKNERRLVKIGLGVAVGQAVTKFVLVPAGLQFVFSRPWAVSVAQAAWEQAFHIPLYSCGVYVVLRRLDRLKVRL
jgi:riboflavin transporter